MSNEANKDVVRRFFEESDRGNLAAVDELYTPDCVLHFPFVPAPLDRSGLHYLLQGFYSAFPDLQHTLDAQIAEGDDVVTRWTFRGTQSGEFQGIPPTGNAVTVSGITVDRVVDGRIVEKWMHGDFLGMMQQLGVIPAPQ